MKLWLLRHPAVDLPGGLCYGQSDVLCEPAGLQSCVQTWVNALPQHAELWHSPLQRCEHPSKKILGQRADISLKNDPRLLEMHFGTWEMQTWNAIGKETIDAWLADFLDGRPGGAAPAESVAEVLARVRSALHSAVVRGSERPLVWLTHAGVIRATLALLRGVSVQHAADWPTDAIDVGSTTLVTIGPDATVFARP